MNWTIAYRVLSGVISLAGAFCLVVIGQYGLAVQAGNPAPVSAGAIFWLSCIAGFCTLALPSLPSLFGQSGVAPPGTSESRVVQQATREAVVDVLTDTDHPIRRQLERTAVP